MGGHPWEYFVSHEASVESALEKLRQKVFASGDFNRSELKPSSIDEALENSAEEGTRSILDINMVGQTPDFCTVCPLADDELERVFGTSEPTHEMIVSNMEAFYNDIERGHGIYIIAYKDRKPSEIFFGGYSFD
jgi:hypothetical protein